jgi:YD repeat-containing protein
VRVIYPSAAGFGLLYSYNNLGQVTEIRENRRPQQAKVYARYSYNEDGSLASEQTPATTRNFNYDRRGRLVSYDDAYLGQTVSYAGYLNGNISSTNFIYKGQAAQFANTYSSITYDRLGRLTSAANSDARYHIGVPSPLSYDRNGNIISLTRSGGMVNYTYANGTNKVTDLSNGKTYKYDLNGNIVLASDKVSQIDYDPYTQMTTAMRTSATELGSDAISTRVKRVSARR